MNERGGANNNALIALGIIFLISSIGGGMYGCPKYNVYVKERAGFAALQEAEWDRKILIEEASAKKLSAQHYADAEVIRARGVAEANEIIGESLKGNDAYLRYLWIQGLHDGSSEIIYVPTEANLPILEATRNIQK